MTLRDARVVQEVEAILEGNSMMQPSWSSSNNEESFVSDATHIGLPNFCKESRHQVPLSALDHQDGLQCFISTLFGISKRLFPSPQEQLCRKPIIDFLYSDVQMADGKNISYIKYTKIIVVWGNYTTNRTYNLAIVVPFRKARDMKQTSSRVFVVLEFSSIKRTLSYLTFKIFLTCF